MPSSRNPLQGPIKIPLRKFRHPLPVLVVPMGDRAVVIADVPPEGAGMSKCLRPRRMTREFMSEDPCAYRDILAAVVEDFRAGDAIVSKRGQPQGVDPHESHVVATVGIPNDLADAGIFGGEDAVEETDRDVVALRGRSDAVAVNRCQELRRIRHPHGSARHHEDPALGHDDDNPAVAGDVVEGDRSAPRRPGNRWQHQTGVGTDPVFWHQALDGCP